MVFDSITPFCTTCLRLTLTEIAWKEVQQKHAYGHDYYFVSQLYEPDWTPRSSVIR